MQRNNSYTQIIRTTGLVGGASLINVVISLVRMKAVALLLGPLGIGLIGLYQNIIATASTIASIGVGNVGTRQIAEANERKDAGIVDEVRKALFVGSLILSFAGISVFWLLRNVLATQILGDSHHSFALGWLSLGVGFTVVASAQVAVLQGLRRTSDIAILSIFSAATSSLIGTIAIYIFGFRGILIFVLAMPASNFLLGALFLSRNASAHINKFSRSLILSQWKSLVRLGVPFMIAGLLATLAQLAVKIIVQKDLGVAALGNFQASWQISMTYVGLVLIAMGTDYYPRLTSVITDKEAATKMANEQTEVALLLAGPVLLFMLALAPWIVEGLYSKEFGSAASIFRLQVIGDLLKVASWPLGYILLASADGRRYLFTEAMAYGSLVLFTAVLLPIMELESTGIAFIVMYAIYLPLVYFSAKRRVGFSWSAAVKIRFLILLFAIAGCSLLTMYAPRAGVAVTLAISGIFALNTLNYLRRLGLLQALTNKLAAAMKK